MSRATQVTSSYASVRRTFTGEELRRLGFRKEDDIWVKRGAGRSRLAQACQHQGAWRVTPLVRVWE